MLYFNVNYQGRGLIWSAEKMKWYFPVKNHLYLSFDIYRFSSKVG